MSHDYLGLYNGLLYLELRFGHGFGHGFGHSFGHSFGHGFGHGFGQVIKFSIIIT